MRDIYIAFKTRIIENINKLRFQLSFLKEKFLLVKLITNEIKKNNPEMNMVVDNKVVPI